MDELATLRSFNRAFTQRIGVLQESYLDAGRPLGPSRLLFEIGDDGARIGELRRRLGLDSGYLSRLLRQLEQEGLVNVVADPADGRQRRAVLTSSGRREWRRLDRRSDEAARRLLAPLPAQRRADFAAALASAEHLLRAATVEAEVVDPGSPAAIAALRRYFGELDARFRSGFDPVAGGADDDLAALRQPAGTFVVVRSDDEVAACGGVQRVDARTGEIKRMWVDPSWRGLGLGQRLLARLETAAADHGWQRVVLDTNETLTEAITMYQRAGYQPIERYNDNPYAHHWFSKHLGPSAEPDGRPPGSA